MAASSARHACDAGERRQPWAQEGGCHRPDSFSRAGRFDAFALALHSSDQHLHFSRRRLSPILDSLSRQPWRIMIRSSGPPSPRITSSCPSPPSRRLTARPMVGCGGEQVSSSRFLLTCSGAGHSAASSTRAIRWSRSSGTSCLRQRDASRTRDLERTAAVGAPRQHRLPNLTLPISRLSRHGTRSGAYGCVISAKHIGTDEM